MTTPERPVRFKPNLCQVFSVYQNTFDKLVALEAKERSVKFWFRLSLIILLAILILTMSSFSVLSFGVKVLIAVVSFALLTALLLTVFRMREIQKDKKDREKEIRLLAEELGYI